MNLLEMCDQELIKIDNKHYPDKYIHIYWVKLHDESEINNKVDVEAEKWQRWLRMSIRLFKKQKLLNPNNFASYNTIKSEINYKTSKYDESK